MLGIEIPLTETLTFLKPYNQYVCRESLKQKNNNKEREREFVLERVEMSIPTYIFLEPGNVRILTFAACARH